MKKLYALLAVTGLATGAAAQCNSTDIYNNDTTNAVCFEVSGRVLKCYSNNIPDHSDSYSSPFTVAADDYEYSMCAYPDTAAHFTPLYEEVETTVGCTDTYTFGVSTNGVKYDPSSAEYFENTDTGENNIEWHKEARYMFDANFGNNGGHLNPFGEYHYHDVPADYFKSDLNIDGSTHSPIVGYAADGFPIYYKHVYENPLDTLSSIVALESGYHQKSGERPGDGVSAPDGAYSGLYYEDYEYTTSDLDSCNGRYGYTPDYPYGTYYYVLTDSYPYIPRCFKGTEVDNSYLVGPSASCDASTASSSCSAPVSGCMDPFAQNYNPSATRDNGTCTYSFQVVLAAASTSCSADDGLINATVFGGTAPYTYTWSNGASAASISDLVPGDYTVTVSDAGSNETIVSATVSTTTRLLDTATGEDEQPGSGYALALDGTDDFVDFRGDLSLTSHTFSAWVNTSNGTSQTLLHLFYDADNYAKVALNAAGRVTATVAESSSAEQAMRSSVSVNDGNWHHIAYSFDASGTGSLNLYIDGVLDNGTTVSSDNLSFSLDASDMHLGANRSESSQFSGTIDEVAIWASALNATAIRGNMCKKVTANHPDNCNLALYLRFDEASGTAATDWAGRNNGYLFADAAFTQSGAPVGDDAEVLTGVSVASSLNIASAKGDDLTATITSGSADALVVYRVDEAPNVTTAPGAFEQLSNSTYFGVKLLGSNSGVYTVELNYDGHTGITDESTLGIATRASNAAISWKEEAGATLNTATNTITLTGQTGTEFILGSKGTNTLPMELVSFTANAQQNETVLLQWVTASEWNNDYFTVERSEDNHSWTTVGLVEATSEGSFGAQYELFDFSPLASRSYYRLKQTDVDGTFTYSKTVAVELQRTVTMKLYPNPTAGYVTVQLDTDDIEQLQVLDMHGRVLLQNTPRQRMDLSTLQPGVYVLRAVGNNGPVAWQNIVRQ